MNTIKAAWRCPYCGLVNNIRVELSELPVSSKFYYCDIEVGGCDNRLVVDVEVKVNTTVYKVVPVVPQPWMPAILERGDVTE